jgi:hypothetical protein
LNAVIEYCDPSVDCSITGKRLAAVAETFGLMKTPPDETGVESTLTTKEAASHEGDESHSHSRSLTSASLEETMPAEYNHPTIHSGLTDLTYSGRKE